MIIRALDAGTPAAWVVGDEVYGGDPGLRADLERRRTRPRPRTSGPDPAHPQRTARLLAALTHPGTASGTGSAGPPGDGATSTAPGKATTSGKPASSEDHDLRLEY
jgi:hypothetical protein